MEISPTRQLVGEVLSLAFPAAGIQILRIGLNTSALILSGIFLDLPAFAAVGLSNSAINMVFMSITVGIAATIDTLCTQEVGRSPTSPVQGLILRRCLIACTLYVCFLFTLVWLFAYSILSSMFSAEIAHHTSLFLYFSLPTILCFSWGTSVCKYLMAQSITSAPLVAHAIGIAVLIPAMYLVAEPFGTAGVALAVGAGRLATLLVLIVYCYRTDHVRTTWGAWGLSHVFDYNGIREFFRAVIPSVVASCAERWGFEGMAIIAAAFGVHVLGAWSVLWSILVILFSSAAGLYQATATLVGNRLGEGKPTEASNTASLAFTCAVALHLPICLGYAIYPRALAGIYTDNEIVKSLCDVAAPFMALALFGDTVGYVTQGALRAAYCLKYLCVVSFVAQWCVMIPFALVLVQRHSIVGLCVAYCVGRTVQLAANIFKIAHLSWGAAASSMLVDTAMDNSALAAEDSEPSSAGIPNITFDEEEMVALSSS